MYQGFVNVKRYRFSYLGIFLQDSRGFKRTLVSLQITCNQIKLQEIKQLEASTCIIDQHKEQTVTVETESFRFTSDPKQTNDQK